MSYTYTLLCYDCRQGLTVGKIVNMDTQGRAIDTRFDRYWKAPGADAAADIPLLTAIERFLILHRGHDLTLVPDDYALSTLDQIHDDLGVAWIDDETLMAVPIESDYEDDVAAALPRLRARLVGELPE